ncbi:hypothetical protein FD45_GL001636 [Liquorilactobacillus nagelii DSM 13675]|nr:hypothetical protein FD45_GL001636 [Liquorilactobacillus nagelii DSM 13675]
MKIMMWNCGNWSSFMNGPMTGGWIFLTFLIIVAFLLVFFFRRRTNRNLDQTTAFKILDESYAKGEITYQEYQTRKNNLKK